MTMQASTLPALPMLPSPLLASVSGMGSPSLAGCNGSATVAVRTSTCMEIRSSWMQLALGLAGRLSAGSGSVGAGGRHGPPWCTCLHLSLSALAHLAAHWHAGGRDWQRCSWRCSKWWMVDGTTLGCVIVDAVAQWGLTSVAARTGYR